MDGKSDYTTRVIDLLIKGKANFVEACMHQLAQMHGKDARRGMQRERETPTDTHTGKLN